jgi:hypothetical protein
MSFAGTCSPCPPGAERGTESHAKKGLPSGVKGSYPKVPEALDPTKGSAEGQAKTGIPGIQPK